MRIAFINPNLSGVVGQNIGLAYVISSVEKNHEVKLLDLTFHPKDYNRYLYKELKEMRPDIIGISANSFSFEDGLRIAGFIKEICPEATFLWGGVHPTLMPEETMQYSLVDAICIGEGEISTLEYLDRLEKGREPDVEGIWYKDRKGKIHKGRPRPFREDIDDLPFPNWDHWDIDRYLKEELFFTGGLRNLASRGCPYSCTFCSNAALSKAGTGRYYRARSPVNVIEEIKSNVQKYLDRGLKSIFLSDDIFGLDAKWLKQFCELYIKEGLSTKIPWACTTRVDILTEDWAKMAGDAGCMMVSLGIESGDENIRKQVYKKNISKDKIMRAVRYLKDKGIICHISLIIGGPGETKDTIRKTMMLAREIQPLTSQYIFYQPLPKTELLASIKKECLVNYDSSQYLNSPMIFTQDLKKKDLLRVKKKIELERLTNFFTQGLRQDGINFFLRVLRFFFSFKNIKKILSRNLHIMTNLEQDILFAHSLRKWKKKRVRLNI